MKNFIQKLGHGVRQVGIVVLSLALIVLISIAILTVVNEAFPPETKTGQTPTYPMRILSEKEVVVAVDQNDNLLLIEKSTGVYRAYSDSVGYTVFRMYANRMFDKAMVE